MLRVFLSYRMADRHGRDTVTAGLPDVAVEDYPVDSRYDLDWKIICGKMIAEADGVVVLVGPTTADSAAVRWEIKWTAHLGKPILGVWWGPRGSVLPEGLPADRVHDWDPARIRKELETWSATDPRVPHSVTTT